jgi:hypothetical protein
MNKSATQNRNDRDEAALCYALDNIPSETAGLVSRAVQLLADIEALAQNNMLADSATAQAGWERIEAKARRVERMIYRIRLDSAQHAARLEFSK